MFSLDKTLATGIGSLPYLDERQAVEHVFTCFRQNIVFWPQLPKKSFFEQMTVQFSEKFPGIAVNQKDKKIFVDTGRKDFSSELEDCLQHYLNDGLDYFAISPEYASGLYALVDALKNRDTSYFSEKQDVSLIKGQTVGPITLGMMLLTDAGQPIIYNPELREVLLKFLAMKTRWQIRKLRTHNPKLKTIIFIDEPYLVSFGSSFFTLKKEDVINCLNEVIDAAHVEGATCGIHCCANTDWSLVLSTNLDILNFDAYGYMDNLFLYGEELNKFLNRGGILAFGIVPNNAEAATEGESGELLRRLSQAMQRHAAIDKIMVTPSCGCGTLDIALAEKINSLCVEISARLNDRLIGKAQ